MDEFEVLKYIFNNNIECVNDSDDIVYKVHFKNNYLEFILNSEYPNAIPIMKGPKKETLEKLERAANKYISTPMIYDLIRLYVKFEEETNLVTDKTSILEIKYNVEDIDKITEEQFLDWKSKNVREKKVIEGITGKAYFLDRKNNKEEIFDEEY